jgi:hypothetical protein
MIARIVEQSKRERVDKVSITVIWGFMLHINGAMSMPYRRLKLMSNLRSKTVGGL